MKSLLMLSTPLLMLMSLSLNAQEPIVTESTTNSTVTTNGKMETVVKTPPPSAISPQIITGGNSDLCTIGVAGAVQTQILGISMGTTLTEENCVTLKRAKTLYDMGMKVAAVATMCSGSQQVFDAMMNAGTPCPYKGLIGDEAKAAWEADSLMASVTVSEEANEPIDDTTKGAGAVAGVLGLLLLL